MRKIIPILIFGTLFLKGISTPEIESVPPPASLIVFRPAEIRKLPENIKTDSFGLTSKGSLVAKKETSPEKSDKFEITLAKVTAGLHLYGLSANFEALVNSILWKVRSKLIVRHQNHDYILILQEVTENRIKIGWQEDEATHEIALATPSNDVILEQPEDAQPQNTESMLVLDTIQTIPRIETKERKR
ncbi:MAG: hypothetical protein V4507_02490 [Verrucomicrobiota bacterium]